MPVHISLFLFVVRGNPLGLSPEVIPGSSFALFPQSPWLSLPRDAQMLMEDVKRIVHELDQGQQLSSIGVELVDNELAILYMNSKKSEVNLLLFPLSVAHLCCLILHLLLWPCLLSSTASYNPSR